MGGAGVVDGRHHARQRAPDQARAFDRLRLAGAKQLGERQARHRKRLLARIGGEDEQRAQGADPGQFHLARRGVGLGHLDPHAAPQGVDRLFYDALVLKVGAALVAAGLAVGIVALLGYSKEVQLLVLLLGVLQALGLATTSAQTIFQTYEQMDYYFYATVPRTIVSALAGLAVIGLGGGIVAVCVAFVVVGALGTAFAFAIMFRWFVRPRREVRFDRLPGLAWRAAPLGVQEALGQVTFRIDIVLLSLLTTSAVVGAYGAGYRILEATLFLAWSVATSVLPMYSYLDRSSRPSLDRVFGASIKFALVLVVPIAVTLFVCSRAVVDLLFGLDEYGETVGALRWLALAIAVYPVGHLA
ncbi:MAG: oligosaccharide flippase family protein, partial [Burkholderiaceae bacterium]|nr:oligosaccharide flippase family protein [Burkholderiaceae bacterium]